MCVCVAHINHAPAQRAGENACSGGEGPEVRYHVGGELDLSNPSFRHHRRDFFQLTTISQHRIAGGVTLLSQNGVVLKNQAKAAAAGGCHSASTPHVMAWSMVICLVRFPLFAAIRQARQRNIMSTHMQENFTFTCWHARYTCMQYNVVDEDEAAQRDSHSQTAHCMHSA